MKLAAILLLLLCGAGNATVIDGRGDIVWAWVWDYDQFVLTSPTTAEHLSYCTQRKDEAMGAVNALWELEMLPAALDVPLDTYAQAVGTAYLAMRYFARCEWRQRNATEGPQ